MRNLCFVLFLFSCVALFLAASDMHAEETEKPTTTVQVSASPSTSASASAEPTHEPLPTFSPAKLELKVGEKHTYEIAWRNISAGLGTMEVAKKEKDKDGEYFAINITAESSKLVSVFYKVEDLFISRLDSKQGFSRKFERYMREGKSFRDEVVTYDYKDNLARYSSKRGRDQETREFSHPIPGKVLDPLGAVFYIRTADFRVGSTVSVPIHSNDKNWPLKLDCVGLVGLRVPGIGKFNSWKLKPTAQKDALFTAGGAMTVWVEKTTKVILRAEVDIPIGSIVIRLIRAENSPLETVNREEKRRRWIRPGTKEIP